MLWNKAANPTELRFAPRQVLNRVAITHKAQTHLLPAFHLKRDEQTVRDLELMNGLDAHSVSALTEALPNLFLEFDLAGRLVRANRQLELIAGYPPTEREGLLYSLLFQGLVARANWEQALSSTDASSLSFNEELTTRSGRSVPLLMGMVRVEMGAGVRIIVGATDLRAQQAAERHLMRLAFFDPLTRLPNREGFKQQLAVRMSNGFKRAGNIAVALLDVTRFRAINDAVGHLGGDEVLCSLAGRLKALLNPEEMVAHISEDEFAVMFTDISDEAQALTAGQRLLDSVREPFVVRGQKFTLNARVGVALVASGLDPSAILRDADNALFEAKESGLLAVRVFDHSMRLANAERLRMDTELRAAIAHHEFRLHLQPLVRLRDRSIVGFEALLRWAHPSGALITSGEFIVQAERSGLITILDEWAMRAALDWLASAPAACYCNVNVSALSLLDADWVARTLELLRAQAEPLGRLHIEITETALFGCPKEVAAILDQLVDAGAQIFLDDFGTGYSSLSHLQRFPISGIKVDRSFVTRLDSSARDRRIIAAMVGLANDLGLSLTAEGVETEAQRTCLIQSGCELAQGYLFGRPVAADEALGAIIKQHTEGVQTWPTVTV